MPCLLQHTHATELFVACPGLFGQVITVVSAPSGHVPMLKRFKVLRLNSRSNTLHTQWTVMVLIWKPLNPIYVEFFEQEN